MKTPGHCTICETPVFQVKRKFPDGTPRQMGKPLPGKARRVTFILMDGTRADLTVCTDCTLYAESLPALHAKILQAFVFEDAHETREMRGSRPLSLREQWIHGAQHLRMATNPPLGVLYEETWEQAMERENHHGRA